MLKFVRQLYAPALVLLFQKYTFPEAKLDRELARPSLVRHIIPIHAIDPLIH